MPLCPLLAATAAEPAGRGRARESFNFTLKAIRAERVQIVNGVASAALVHGLRENDAIGGSAARRQLRAQHLVGAG